MRIGAILLLLAVGLSYHEETEFLTNAGFPHLVDNFHNEEIIMRMMTRLTNQEMTELGLTTMGARMRFREAVESWIARDAAGVPEAGEASGDGREAASIDGEAAAEVQEVQEQRRTSNNTVAERVDEAVVQEENDQIVEVEGMIDNERNLICYAKTLSTGRVTHHFLDHFYRYDRNKVRPNGRAFFRCSVRGCTAR